MAEKLFLELISPEKALVSAEVDSVVATGTCGEFGLLPGHSPFLTSLKVGGVSYSIGNETTHIAINKGFLEVSGDKVIVLVEKAEFGKDVDVHKTRELKAEAEKTLTETKVEASEAFSDVLGVIEYQDAKLDAAEKSK